MIDLDLWHIFETENPAVFSACISSGSKRHVEPNTKRMQAASGEDHQRLRVSYAEQHVNMKDVWGIILKPRSVVPSLGEGLHEASRRHQTDRWYSLRGRWWRGRSSRRHR